MHSLISDRFLRRFGGNAKRKQKKSIVQEEILSDAEAMEADNPDSFDTRDGMKEQNSQGDDTDPINHSRLRKA